jgi:hypothetical protein
MSRIYKQVYLGDNMNLGIYLENINNNIQFDVAHKLSSFCVQSNTFNDVSIFYDNIGPAPQQFVCGSFNSTDVWNFNGRILVFSLDSARMCLNIVNNFEIYYYMGLEEIDVLNLLDLMNNGLKVICCNKDAKKKFYRVTDKFPIGTSLNVKNLVRYLMV